MGLLSVQHWTPAELIANYVAALDRDTETDRDEIDRLKGRITEIEADIEKRAHLRATHLALMATADPVPAGGDIHAVEPSFDEVASTMSGRVAVQ